MPSGGARCHDVMSVHWCSKALVLLLAHMWLSPSPLFSLNSEQGLGSSTGTLNLSAPMVVICQQHLRAARHARWFRGPKGGPFNHNSNPQRLVV